MVRKKSTSVPFIRGRKVGPDAIVNRNEQWAARAREANPPRDEWFISTMPMHGHNGLVVNDALDENLHIVPLPSLSSILDATAIRIKIVTGDSGKHIRVCLYEYKTDLSYRNRALRKVTNSELAIDVSTRFVSAPLDSPLDGVATVHPGRAYFMGYRSNTTTVRVPVNDTLGGGITIGHFPKYTLVGYPDETLPSTIRFSDLNKADNYSGNVPWLTYISNEAKNLL